MSPHEWDEYAEAFADAAEKFGWIRGERVDRHERDDTYGSYLTEYWADAAGVWLFDESDVGERLVQELIRIATLLPGRGNENG